MKNWMITIAVLLTSLAAHAQNTYQEAMDAYENKEYHLAIGLFTKVIDANEKSVDLAHNFRGEAYQILKDNDNAFEDYNKAIELNPEYAMAYQNRGTLYQSYWFKYDKAMDDYNKAIKLNPEFALAYFNRASLKWYMGDLKGALADYNKMLSDFNADDPEVIGYVARIRTELGMVEPMVNNTTSKEPNEEQPIVNNTTSKEPTDEQPVVNNTTSKEPTDEQPVVNNTTSKEPTDEQPVVNNTTSKEPTEEQPVVNNTTTKEPTEEQPVVNNTTTKEPTEEQPVVNNTTTKEPTEEQPVVNNTTTKEPTDNSSLNIYWINPDPSELPEGTLVVENELLTIKLKTSSTQELIADNFTVSINGLPANYRSDAPKIIAHAGVVTYTNKVKLEPETNIIKVRISNSTGSVYSNELKVIYSQRKPDLHVLSIGPKTINLKYTQKDAEDFADIFSGQEGEGNNKIFANVFPKKLTGEKATTNEIRGVIEEYLSQREVKPSDMVVLFVSSHGFMEKDDFRIHGSDYNPLRRLSTSVSFKDDITAHLSSLNCKKIVFIDACHSGGARGDVLNINEAIKQVSQKQNISLTFTSSSQNQLSYEDETWDNGAFTKALIDGMKYGKADVNEDKIVTVEELSNYVTTSVRTMVRELKNELQEPSFINDDNKGVERSLPIYVIEE